MPYWNTILIKGKFTRGTITDKGGGQAFESKNGQPIPLSDENVIHFANQGKVVWSEHPEIQYRMALGRWKQKRRQGIDEPKPTRDNYEWVQAPGFPADAYRPREGMLEDPQMLKREIPHIPPPVVESAPTIDNERAALLRARYLARNYKSLETFAKLMRVDEGELRAIAERDGWEAAKSNAANS